jgi:hypothetical protein
MAIIDIQVRTITCNAPDCGHTVTFDRREEKQVFETPENAWLKTSRVVQTADGRNLVYCSDECTVKGAATGIMNVPLAPAIIPGANAQAVAIAARAAEQARAAEHAIREGKPANITVTDK